MQPETKKGVGFGLTSGTITTLGLMTGLQSSTSSTVAVVAGIVIIAFSDSLSDALGMHLSAETDARQTDRQIWQTTGATFFAKILTAGVFIIPTLIFPLSLAVIINIIIGFVILTVFSYILARSEKKNPAKVILEHVSIATIVILATHYIGLALRNIK